MLTRVLAEHLEMHIVVLIPGVIGQPPDHLHVKKNDGMYCMKQNIFFIALGSFIVLFVLTGVLSLLSHKQTSHTVVFPPAPTPLSVPETHFGNIRYEPTQTVKMIQQIENRPSIPPSDSDIKTVIVNSIGNDSGTVNKVDNEYRVDYLKTQDFFQVEIDTTDIQKAKTDAVAWFTSQGMSHEGICKLPLIFYLNFYIKKELPQATLFNPLPEGC